MNDETNSHNYANLRPGWVVIEKIFLVAFYSVSGTHIDIPRIFRSRYLGGWNP